MCRPVVSHAKLQQRIRHPRELACTTIFVRPKALLSRSLVWKPQPPPGTRVQGKIKFLHLFQVQLSRLCSHHWKSLIWAAMVSRRNPILIHHGRSSSDNKMVLHRDRPSHRHGHCLSSFRCPNYSETRLRPKSKRCGRTTTMSI